MKFFLIAIVTLMVFSCEPQVGSPEWIESHPDKVSETHVSGYVPVIGATWSVVMIDSCEYILFYGFGYSGDDLVVVHKGDCRNSAHAKPGVK